MPGHIRVSRDGTVIWLTIDHPQRKNALTYAMWRDITQVLGEVAGDSGVRAVVIRGAGHDAFSAGADISEFEERRADGTAAEEYDRAVRAAVLALKQMTPLTLACLRGDAAGGGAELALGADTRFAGRSLCMAFTPAKLGIVYGPEETQELIERVGASRALELLATGRAVTAEEALAWGLVNHVVDDKDLDGAVRDFLEQITHNSWEAVRRTKEMVRRLMVGESPESPELRRLVYEAYVYGDYGERVARFLAKKRP